MALAPKAIPKSISAKARLAHTFLRSYVGAADQREAFAKVRTYCMFLGYPRSGHSLVGSLLDAHPHAIIAHEQHALRYVRYHFSRDQLFWLLLENSREFTARGREWTGYSYHVPDQWHGRFSELRVIGDKRGGTSIRKLQKQPHLLGRLRRLVGVPVKFIHVVRNPFDNMSTMHVKSGRGRPLDYTIGHYFSMARAIHALSGELAPGELFELRHEDLIAEPKARLAELCGFLGLEPGEDYLRACASIVFDSPRKTRKDVPWTPALLERVRREMDALPALEGYSFDV